MGAEVLQNKKKLETVIVEITASFYGKTYEDFITHKGRYTSHEDAYQRHMSYYLLKQYSFISCQGIGDIFGTRFTTIDSGIKKIEDLITYNRRTIGDLQSLKRLIDNFKAKSTEILQ